MGGGESDYIEPNVSHCVQENHVHYNPYYAPIVATFTISAEKAATPTKLYYYYDETTDEEWRTVGTELFKKMEIDGTSVSISNIDSAQGNYQLSEGTHTVKYYLKNQKLIKTYLFGRINEITSVIVPNGVEVIGEQAFDMTYNLKSVTLPNTLKIIMTDAFNSSGIESIVIPDSVEEIKNSAFYFCGLKRIHIGKGLKTIAGGYNTICEGAPIEYVTVDPANTVYDSRNNCNAIIETATNTLICGSSNTVIPISVTKVGDDAFEGRVGLTDMTIPNGVSSIGSYAFNNCHNLQNIIMPNSVTTIGAQAFASCTSLTNFTIPDSITHIDKYAFKNCSSLNSITSLATTAPTIYSTTFRDVKTGGTLTVPSGNTGYDVWMGTGNYYLGKYGWTKVEQ